jgi:hypothetical protein
LDAGATELVEELFDDGVEELLDGALELQPPRVTAIAKEAVAVRPADPIARTFIAMSSNLTSVTCARHRIGTGFAVVFVNISRDSS